MNSNLTKKSLLMLGVLGASFSSIFVTYSTAPSSVLACYRLGLSVLLLCPFALKSNYSEIKNISKKSLLGCILSGIFLALHFTFWFESLKYTSISSSTIIVCLEGVFCAIGYRLIFKGSIPKAGYFAIALSFLGSALIALSDSSASSHMLYGDMLAFFGAIFVAGYTLIGNRQRKHLSTSVYTFYTYISCFICLVLMNLLTGTSLVGYGAKEYLLGLGLAVFSTILGHSVFSYSLKFLSPTYVANCKLLEPVYASILAIFIFGQIPNLVKIVGAIVVISGVVLYSKYE